MEKAPQEALNIDNSTHLKPDEIQSNSANHRDILSPAIEIIMGFLTPLFHHKMWPCKRGFEDKEVIQRRHAFNRKPLSLFITLPLKDLIIYVVILALCSFNTSFSPVLFALTADIFWYSGSHLDSKINTQPADLTRLRYGWAGVNIMPSKLGRCL